MHVLRENKWGIGLMLIGAGLSFLGIALGKFAAVAVGVLLVLAGIGVITLPRRKKSPQPEKEPPPLKQRTIELANELLAFLHKQGPKPANPLSSKGSEEEQRRVFNAYFDWIKETYFKYMAYYKDRVVKTDFELAAHGFFTRLEPREINPPPTSNEVDVQKIAEALLLTASKLPKG